MYILQFQVGFNAGDGIRYFNIPNSRTPAIIDIPSTSNYQKPGFWIFQVDEGTVENQGCSSNGAGKIPFYITSPKVNVLPIKLFYH